MIGKKHLLFLVLLFGTFRHGDGFLSWFFNGRAGEESETDTSTTVQVSMNREAAPFEMKTTDEKFLMDAQLTADLSPLDACHHMVVAEIQSTCSDLTEEELAKLSVQLLNCQSEAEGRTVYPCTYDMTIAECTRDMDPTTWNAYQIVGNRARAICYGARQQQFRMKTEFTVNQLVHTTRGQLESMKELQEGQDKISDATSDTLQKMHQGQQDLMVRQETLKSAQSDVHSYIAGNLRELMREKSLIAAGNRELAAMTEGIREKIEEATEKLATQESQQKENHMEILEDLASIRDKAKEVWEKIDNSSKQVLEFHDETQQHYKETLDNLQKVNSSLAYMLNATNDMRNVLEEKINWVLNLIGGTGDKVALITTVILHTGYFLLAALSATFLHTPMFSRIVLLVLVPLNAVAETRQGQSLGFTAMTMLIVLTVTANWIANWTLSLWRYRLTARKQKPLSIMSPPPMAALTNTAVDSQASDTPTNLINENPHAGPPTHDGLATPDFRKLVDILEKLYQTGALTPVVSKRPLSQTEPPSSADDEPVSKSARAKKPRGKVPPPTPVQLLGNLESDGSTGVVADSPRMDLVKRHLMKTLDNGSPARSASKREVSDLKKEVNDLEISRDMADFSPPPSRCSTPVKDSPRSRSRQSTPGRSFLRPLCLATTKANLPCKNPSIEGSAFCHKHQV